ncbi:MAG: Crp/Fnr family transcriptional regulator [Bacteroidales bacterium]
MNEFENIQSLVESHWLSKVLKPQDLNILFQKSAVVKYKKRETIVKKGEFATHLILVMDGFVKVEIEEGKKNFILDIVRGLNFIGLPLVLSLEKYLFSVVTLSDSEVRFIPLETVKEVLKDNTELSMAVIEYGNSHFVMPILEKLQSATRNNIRGRLAKLILNLATKTHQSKRFVLLISRFEMAQMIGFSRENVIRMLTEFHNEGIIKISGKSLEIIDFARLEELAKYS